MEHLHRVVGVEARQDLRDRAEVAVDELAETTVVVDGAGARAPRDEELEVRDTEGVLNIDGEETEAKGILGRGPEAVLVRPGRRLARTILVRDSPDLADVARVEVCRDRELMHVRSKCGNRDRAHVASSLT
jgi:hypothetical protein